MSQFVFSYIRDYTAVRFIITLVYVSVIMLRSFAVAAMYVATLYQHHTTIVFFYKIPYCSRNYIAIRCLF